MNCLLKCSTYIWAICCIVMTPAMAEPYHLIAGNSALGFRENDKQNVNLGFNAVFNELLSSYNIKCEIKNFDSSEELALAIKNNQVNAFFGSPVEFIKSEAYLSNESLAGGVFDGQVRSKIFLLVRKDSGIDTLMQLKGKRLSTQKLISEDAGGVFLENILLENKLPLPTRFFSEIQYKDTSNKALMDLFFKKSDVALMSENQFNIAAELNPQLRLQTKVIMASEAYVLFVAALAKNTPAVEDKNIHKALFAMNKTPKGRSILNLMKAEKFQEIVSAELDNVRALVEKNKQLKAQVNVH